jgi:hypothetical protein
MLGVCIAPVTAQLMITLPLATMLSRQKYQFSYE